MARHNETEGYPLADQKTRDFIADIYTAAQAKKASKTAGGPEVGIFWLLDGKLIEDSTPIREAQDYGEFKYHSRDHYSMWPVYQRHGIAPQDLEYEEVPRGRIVYNSKTKEFTLLADKCILNNKKIVQKILSDFHLPNTTKVNADPHYKCSNCGG